MTSHIKYIVFGSATSIDKDLFVILDKLPDTIDECKKTCKYIEQVLQKHFLEEVNVNIGTIENGIVTSVMKGTADEVNNCIFYTEVLHHENTETFIFSLLDRDIERKILRAFRIMLSLISRTSHRILVKTALRGDINEKLELLSNIDLRDIKELGKTNMGWPDYLKTMSFQIGQTIALLDTKELFTKEDIAIHYPKLKPYIERDIYADLGDLENAKNELIKRVKKRGMKQIKEY